MSLHTRPAASTCELALFCIYHVGSLQSTCVTRVMQRRLGAGEFSAATSRVLHMVRNPEALAQRAAQQARADAAEAEAARLHAQLQARGLPRAARVFCRVHTGVVKGEHTFGPAAGARRRHRGWGSPTARTTSFSDGCFYN